MNPPREPINLLKSFISMSFPLSDFAGVRYGFLAGADGAAYVILVKQGRGNQTISRAFVAPAFHQSFFGKFYGLVIFFIPAVITRYYKIGKIIRIIIGISRDASLRKPALLR